MEDWGQKYSEIRPKHETFCEELFSLLTKLLNEKSIKFHTIEKRAKSIDSFKDKIVRPGKTYKNPLEEIMDLSGLRIIIYYEDDIDKVCSLIDNEFKVHFTEDKSSSLSPDQFGYNSVHKGISLSDRRANLREWSSCKGLKAEVQIRTVLQHAWSSISHALSYKHEADVPKQDQRALNGLAALLELVDKEFTRLRESQAAWNKESKKQIEAKNLNIPIDAISLANYIESSTSVKDVLESARISGMNFVDDDDASGLIALCKMAEVKGIQDLENLLSEYKVESMKYWPIRFAMFEKGLFGSKYDLLIDFLIGILVGGLGTQIDKQMIRTTLDWGLHSIDESIEAGKVFKK